MALQIEYTDATRTTHPESYWRLVYLQINANGYSAVMTFCGYHNISAADRNNLAASIGQCTFNISGAEFVALASSEAQGETPWSVIATACYNTAKTKEPFLNAIDV